MALPTASATTNSFNPGLAISNNTSSLFLGAPQRSWMQPPDPQFPTPPTQYRPPQPVRRPSKKRTPSHNAVPSDLPPNPPPQHSLPATVSPPASPRQDSTLPILVDSVQTHSTQHQAAGTIPIPPALSMAVSPSTGDILTTRVRSFLQEFWGGDLHYGLPPNYQTLISNEELMNRYSSFCNKLKNAGGSSSHVWNSNGTGILDLAMRTHHGHLSPFALRQASHDVENWTFQDGHDPILKSTERASEPSQQEVPETARSRKRPSMADQSNTRHTRSRDDWPIQLPTPSPNTSPVPQSTIAWKQRYNSAIRNLQSTGTRPVDQQPVNDIPRLEMLRDACNADDVFYIMTHAVFCAWSAGHEDLLKPLSLTNEQRSGLAILEQILGSQRSLTREVATMFLHFADPRTCFNSSSFLTSWTNIQLFLVALNTHFHPVRAFLQSRAYPPHPQEVCSWFVLPSPVLQRAIHQSYLRDLSPDLPYMAKAMELFLQEIVSPAVATSQEHRDKLWRDHFEHLFHLRTLHVQNLHSTQSGAGVHQQQMQQSVAFNQRVFLSYQNQAATTSVSNTASHVNPFPVAVDGSSDATRTRPMKQMPNTQARKTLPSYRSGNPPPSAQDQRRPPRFHNPPTMYPSQRVQYPAGNTTLTPVQYQHLALSPGLPGNVNLLVNLDTRPAAPSTTAAGQVQRSRPRPASWTSNPAPQALTGQSQRQPQTLITSGRFFPASANPQDLLRTFAQPAPERRAIHQADTHSPTYCRHLDLPDWQQFRYYRYVEDVVLMPQPIDIHSGLMTWALELAPDLMADKVKTTLTIGETGLRRCVVADGSAQFRLKCIARESLDGADGKSKAEAATTPNTWPKCVPVSINDDFGVDFRRKAQYGVDISTDITDLLHDGPNMVKLSVSFTPQEKSIVYQMGVEIIRIASHEKVALMPQTMSSEQVKASIISTMSRKGQEDDELVVVDPVISIDTVDPFTSKLWVTPVRGKLCRHREAFDLEAFLQSRTSRVKGSTVTNPDQWKCPICKTDARPQSLVIDGFLLEVRAQLETQNLLETKAILVKEDGTWDAKTEAPLTSSKGSESTAADKQDAKASTGPVKVDWTPSIPRQDTVIILDDDT
ncbi:hypothetical protein LTR84_011560 [Exophiala bonariae]|uniref:SP-RING-type domain-containing protein n=1 Tax=Exophiala bonariae TaxID=1690606 RepID=A0AAV9NHR3_9EURO|nr:hypothetical protein LTR84_011560 [Exophiala bonariae]